MRVISFHTLEPYYQRSAKNLADALGKLGISYTIEPLASANLDWAQVTAQKVQFISKCFAEHQDERLIWLDVDTQVLRWPRELNDFSADIVGFARSGAPYSELNTFARFWTPGLLGFRRTAETFGFLEAARMAADRAGATSFTDDYLFEEAWREVGDQLTFQVLTPYLMRSDLGSPQHLDKVGRAAFAFGHSGNVEHFRQRVLSHQPRVGKSTEVTSVKKLLALALEAAIRKLGGRHSGRRI